ncbi:DUF2514 family protein [Paracandidimonas lactea]|uniref:DUF2514 family protein n=1 Tax=Paracandidimonas lactea TaxID=2895524 RepID=UPI001F3D96E6|nr:DUF2514 family protein [Paracandidimonas lactea]
MFKTALAMLGGWKGYVAALAAGALLAGIGAWTVQGWRTDAQLASLRADHAAVLEQQAQAVVASVQAARDLEQRRTAAVENERDNAIEQSTALAADVAAGRTAAQRLRRELSALRERQAGGDTASAQRGPGQSGTDAIGLLIELYAGLDGAGREVAEYADRLRIAGLTCERSYDRVRR